MLEYVDHLIEEWKRNPLWHHLHNLSYTASGYGKKIPTEYMVRIGPRWHRVYCIIFSNAGSVYIILKGNREFISTNSPDLPRPSKDESRSAGNAVNPIPTS